MEVNVVDYGGYWILVNGLGMWWAEKMGMLKVLGPYKENCQGRYKDYQP